MRQFRLMTWFLATASLGCPESDEEKVAGLIDAYIRELQDQAGITCDCYRELQFESKNACLSDLDVLPSTRRCIEDALNEDSAASSDWLNCVVPLEEEFATCLDDRLDCTDVSPTGACLEDYNLGLEQCIILPQSVQRKLEACGI